VAAGTNQVERQRWNNEQWAQLWPKRERLTSLIAPVLLDALALSAGERVLDIGCGAGATTLKAAEMVGQHGAVVGADISEPLTALARQRAQHADVSNVSFHVVDAQIADIDGGPFTTAMSQFGVMFFDEPVVAFSNIRRHLIPSGRLGFACWQSLAKNPWFPAASLAGIAPLPPQPAEGKSPTGPFALADPDYVTGILSQAGFAGVAVAAHEMTTDVPEDSVLDDAQLVFMGVPADRMEQARAAADRHFDQFRADSGLCRFPLAYQIVTARNG
jgi:SAM-dependent methyltransferase